MTRRCRFCDAPLTETFCDLGSTPSANCYPKDAAQQEMWVDLHAYVCGACKLVQIGDSLSPEALFSDYAYVSSCSESWVEHARQFTEAMIERFSILPSQCVVEIASNDGYLLQHFRKRGISILGIEPALNIAKLAQDKGIPTLGRFFSHSLATELQHKADFLIANNVLAHVPEVNDFVAGLKTLLAPQGVASLEFHHLLRLMEENQFDTIYHEHFCYFSFLTLEKIFAHHGLQIFDVEQIPTHGGSLRIFAQHAGGGRPLHQHLEEVRTQELIAGLHRLETYRSFAKRPLRLKEQLLRFLLTAKAEGKTTVGYGAPAKGNTLLNYCGIGPDLLPYTVDKSPYKQGHLLPGVRIPIYDVTKVEETKPDYLLILPWNLAAEIRKQMAGIARWGGRFVVPIPELTVL